jgi:hypothetical protein
VEKYFGRPWLGVEAFVPNACLFDFGAGHKHRYILRDSVLRMAAKCELLATSRKTGEIGTRATLACRIDGQFGLWLSLVERLVRDQEAVGSNPTSPIVPRKRNRLNI